MKEHFLWLTFNNGSSSFKLECKFGLLKWNIVEAPKQKPDINLHHFDKGAFHEEKEKRIRFQSVANFRRNFICATN